MIDITRHIQHIHVTRFGSVASVAAVKETEHMP